MPVTKEQKAGIVTAVLSSLIVASILGGISLGRSDAEQSEKIRQVEQDIRDVQPTIETVKADINARLDRERQRTNEQLSDIKSAIDAAEKRRAADAAELRALIQKLMEHGK